MLMEKVFQTLSADETVELGKRIGKNLIPGDVILLTIYIIL